MELFKIIIGVLPILFAFSAMASKGGLGGTSSAKTANFDYPFNYAGVPATLSVKIKTYQEKKYSCLRSFAASIDLQLEGRSRQSLGWIYAYTLDKRILGADGQLVWLSELLQFSKRQKAPHRGHAPEHAVIDETQRIFQLMFDQRGAVREDFKAYERSLIEERLHYVSHFVLEDNFIGQGMGPPVMQAYLQGIQSLPYGDDVHGTVFLSPGAIVDNYEEQKRSKALAGGRAYSYQQVQDILIRGHEKSGYELWFKASSTKEGGDIAIMGLVLPPRQVSPTAEEDLDMNDASSEGDELGETIDSFLATVEAMMELGDDPLDILSGESQTPTVGTSDVQMTDSSSSDLQDDQRSKSVGLSSTTSTKPDKSALERAMRAGETYLWSGSRFLVDHDIDLKWLLRARESNRKLIQALFPDYELPPPVIRRFLSAKVSLDPEREYPVRRILAEEGNRYLIQWEDDTDTGRSFRPTWEPKDHANALAVAEWQQRKTHASAPRKH